MQRFVWLLPIVLFCACQSETEGMKLLCESINQPEIAKASAADKPLKVAAYAEKHVKNKKVKELLFSSESMKTNARAARFSDYAKSLGLKDCALSESSLMKK